MIYIIIFLIIIIIGLLFATKKPKSNDNKRQNINNNDYKNSNEYENNDYYENNDNYYPYHKKYLLTKNEYYFYRNLKKISDELGLQILSKIRLADLIEVNKGLTKSEWNKYFSKIKSKHVDFAIADNMKIKLLIELDDDSHNSSKREARDNFIENALYTAGYKLIRTYGNTKEIENYFNYQETTEKYIERINNNGQ